jgi:hypothetical protein
VIALAQCHIQGLGENEQRSACRLGRVWPVSMKLVCRLENPAREARSS